jgi:hypothetical protein
MKRQPRSDRKLVLRPQTVRQLTRLDLAEVAAGVPTTTVLPTHGLCTQLDC